MENLPVYASHEYANYVVQKCIGERISSDWVVSLGQAFIRNKQAIQSHWNSSHVQRVDPKRVMRTLNDALFKRDEVKLVQQFAECLFETRVEWHWLSHTKQWKMKHLVEQHTLHEESAIDGQSMTEDGDANMKYQ